MSSTDNLRVDYSKYEVEEIADIISDAIIFPIYIGKVAIKVVFFFILVGVLLSYFFTGNFFFGFLFFLISFVLSIPSMVLISCISLTNTIKNDLNTIIKICFDTSKHVYNDSKLVYNQRELGVPLKSTFNDVFRGVAIYVIRPSLKKVLLRRIKFLALPFTFIIDQIFRLVFISKKIKVVENKKGYSEQLKTSAEIIDEIDNFKYEDFKMVSVPIKIINFPLFIILFIYGSINIFIEWILLLVF